MGFLKTFHLSSKKPHGWEEASWLRTERSLLEERWNVFTKAISSRLRTYTDVTDSPFSGLTCCEPSLLTSLSLFDANRVLTFLTFHSWNLTIWRSIFVVHENHRFFWLPKPIHHQRSLALTPQTFAGVYGAIVSVKSKMTLTRVSSACLLMLMDGVNISGQSGPRSVSREVHTPWFMARHDKSPPLFREKRRRRRRRWSSDLLHWPAMALVTCKQACSSRACSLVRSSSYWSTLPPSSALCFFILVFLALTPSLSSCLYFSSTFCLKFPNKPLLPPVPTASPLLPFHLLFLLLLLFLFSSSFLLAYLSICIALSPVTVIQPVLSQKQIRSHYCSVAAR